MKPHYTTCKFNFFGLGFILKKIKEGIAYGYCKQEMSKITPSILPKGCIAQLRSSRQRKQTICHRDSANNNIQMSVNYKF